MTPDFVKAEAKFLAVLLASAAIFTSGWLVGGWRKDAEIAQLEKSYADGRAAAATENARKLATAQRAADGLAAQLAAKESQLNILTEEQTRAVKRFTSNRACLSAGAVRVLNNQPGGVMPGLVAPAPGEPVPADAGFASDTDVAEWAINARRSYDTCRARLGAIADFYKEAGGE